MSSDHNEIQLEINNKKSLEKSPNIWKLSNILLHNPCVKEEIIKYLDFHAKKMYYTCVMQLKQNLVRNLSY